jgi:hypothetical protein
MAMKGKCIYKSGLVLPQAIEADLQQTCSEKSTHLVHGQLLELHNVQVPQVQVPLLLGDVDLEGLGGRRAVSGVHVQQDWLPSTAAVQGGEGEGQALQGSSSANSNEVVDL